VQALDAAGWLARISEAKFPSHLSALARRITKTAHAQCTIKGYGAGTRKSRELGHLDNDWHQHSYIKECDC
jgi:hypothetical protein